MASVKFVSLNCRGLNDYKKRVILYDWLSDSKCDVAFLQETHYVEERKYIYNSSLFIAFPHHHTVKVFRF